MPSFADPIVAVSLSLGDRSGITLFAPPWEDSDGEEWQGFLGDGSKIVLLGTSDELNTWLGDHPDHDLADHPAWKSFSNKGKKALSPAAEAAYDFDEVYALAAAEAGPETVSKLADTVDMAGRIADCCEDGMLRSLLNGTREYALLVEAETDYHDKDGQLEWNRLGDVVAESWERAMIRIGSWLRWEGSSAVPAETSEDDDTD
ncbi:MAG: hypothetical protein M3Y42_15265 [Actinomycetota bacterium]|nr:hypothetical protein [Actinomycetota bacterium]MDQ2958312.1 hypothetical protein [Actinomycetota bacterium]